MGMTLWLKVRDGDRVDCDQADRTLMNTLSEEIDEAIAGLGVRPLTDFHDYTDIARDFGEELEAGDDDEADPGDDEADEERPALTADDYAWFDPAEGLASVDAALGRIRDDASLFAFEGDATRGHWRGLLIDELGSCRATLEEADGRGRLFHLSLVG